MASENDPVKLLLPYLQRADELQKHDSLVSYYCRLYAMERGLKILQHERTKMTNSLLVSLIIKLEKDKTSVKFGTDDHLHLEGFALNVFGKADRQDRAGRSDLNTAKTFYAASIFFEILNQFGELSPDLVQKQKYAAWKAADIRKALKEGRKPVPGPHGGESNLSKSSSFASDAVDFVPRHSRCDTNPGPKLGPSPASHDPLQQPRHSRCDTNPGPKLGPSPPAFHDSLQQQPSAKIASSPPSYPSADYPCHDHQSPHPISRSVSCTYSQTYHQPSYPQEHRHQQHVLQNYPSQEVPPSFSYQNLQSNSKFSEGSLSAAPTHCSSNYQHADASYSHQSVPHVTNYSPPSQYNSTCGNRSVSDSAPISAQAYHYDSNYQPPHEKIAEAQKAARLAVGALAFDDVSIAVEHLRKSLELLTNPSAGLASDFANLRCIIWLVDYKRATYSKYFKLIANDPST